MTKDKFRDAISAYRISEAEGDAPAPAPDAGAPAPGGDVAAPMPDMGGGAPGGGMDLGGMGLPGADGGMGGDQAAGGEINDLCSARYVKLVSFLCELYNANMSSKKNLVLNLKVKVGNLSTLNDEHNAKEVMRFMVDNLLNPDIVEAVKKNAEDAEDQIKEIENGPDFAKYVIHNSTSSFLIDVATYAYYAVSSNAVGDKLPSINYGIDKDFPVDPKNAKSVFDEIKANIDSQKEISEIEEE